MKRILLLIAAIGSPAFSQNDQQEQKNDTLVTGAKAISQGNFAEIRKVAPLAGAPVGQPRVSWRKAYPPPRDQGNVNSGVPFAIRHSPFAMPPSRF